MCDAIFLILQIDFFECVLRVIYNDMFYINLINVKIATYETNVNNFMSDVNNEYKRYDKFLIRRIRHNA